MEKSISLQNLQYQPFANIPILHFSPNWNHSFSRMDENFYRILCIDGFKVFRVLYMRWDKNKSRGVNSIYLQQHVLSDFNKYSLGYEIDGWCRSTIDRKYMMWWNWKRNESNRNHQISSVLKVMAIRMDVQPKTLAWNVYRSKVFIFLVCCFRSRKW